jgi:hypothetical protein
MGLLSCRSRWLMATLLPRLASSPSIQRMLHRRVIARDAVAGEERSNVEPFDPEIALGARKRCSAMTNAASSWRDPSGCVAGRPALAPAPWSR